MDDGFLTDNDLQSILVSEPSDILTNINDGLVDLNQIEDYLSVESKEHSNSVSHLTHAAKILLSEQLPDSPPDSGSEPPISPCSSSLHLPNLTNDRLHMNSCNRLPLSSNGTIDFRNLATLSTNPYLAACGSHVYPIQSSDHMNRMHTDYSQSDPSMSTAQSNSVTGSMCYYQGLDNTLAYACNTTGPLTGDTDSSRVYHAASECSGQLLPDTSHPYYSCNPPTSAYKRPLFVSSDIKQEMMYSDDTSFSNKAFCNSERQMKRDALSHLDGNRNDVPYSDMSVSVDLQQCIQFTPFRQEMWHVLYDKNMSSIKSPLMKIDADKGFTFSTFDDAFVSQKKNHFQISCHIVGCDTLPAYMYCLNDEGCTLQVVAFQLSFFGIKLDNPDYKIRIEQSQTDRSKRTYDPIAIKFDAKFSSKVTVGRLHFSETTTNNMRKKGKPNPDQRFFHLIVCLNAITTCHQTLCVTQYTSGRIIVRASNPSQFELDTDSVWLRGHTNDSVFHTGVVGVNTDHPDEALTVVGNCKLTGRLYNPSDVRIKSHVREMDTRKMLNNVQQLRLVSYNYDEKYAEHTGIEAATRDVGVIAQEVQTVLPDAVKVSAGVTQLSAERSINNLLIVNKERLFMENVGAVKELCRVTDTLEDRIEDLEKVAFKLPSFLRFSTAKSFSIHPSDFICKFSNKIDFTFAHHSNVFKYMALVLSFCILICGISCLFAIPMFISNLNSMYFNYSGNFLVVRPDNAYNESYVREYWRRMNFSRILIGYNSSCQKTPDICAELTCCNSSLTEYSDLNISNNLLQFVFNPEFNESNYINRTSDHELDPFSFMNRSIHNIEFGPIMYFWFEQFNLTIDARFCDYEQTSLSGCVYRDNRNFTLKFNFASYIYFSLLNVHMSVYSQRNNKLPLLRHCFHLDRVIRSSPCNVISSTAHNSSAHLPPYKLAATNSTSNDTSPIHHLIVDVQRWTRRIYVIRVNDIGYDEDPCTKDTKYGISQFYEYNLIFDRC